MPGVHSTLSPSKAHRWRPCSACIRECLDLPDEAGEEAHQGTVFHHFTGLALFAGIEPWGMVGSRLLCEDGVSREYTEEMARKSLEGLDLMWSIAAPDDAEFYVEERVDTSPWCGEGEGGTSDAFVIDYGKKRLTVFDWKWGVGVPVSPIWNDQAVLYALGVWHSFAREKFEAAGIDPAEVEVEIIIEQPRAPGGGGVWKTRMSHLLTEGRNIRGDAEMTRDPDAPHNPGVKQCQFCPAARFNTCKARSDWLLDMLLDEELDPDDAGAKVEARDRLDLIDRRTLTPEQRSVILLNEKAITKWLTQLYEEAMDDAAKGRPVPGLKRVAGRAGRRSWKDIDKAEKIVIDQLGDDAFERKLLTPAKVEDEVGKAVYRERFKSLVEQKDGSPALVSEDDPKPALQTAEDLLDAAWVEPDEPESLI